VGVNPRSSDQRALAPKGRPNVVRLQKGSAPFGAAEERRAFCVHGFYPRLLRFSYFVAFNP
jgi:hypothetical protein